MTGNTIWVQNETLRITNNNGCKMKLKKLSFPKLQKDRMCQFQAI